MTPERRQEIRAALSDREALICTLLGEAAGEPVEGQIAVASVIRNRATHPRWWGNGYAAVCLKDHQFSCWWEDNANTGRVYGLALQLLEGQPIGNAGVVPQLAWIAEGIIGQQLLDRSHGADHYVTATLYGSMKAPAWARAPHIAKVGGHVFFNLELG